MTTWVPVLRSSVARCTASGTRDIERRRNKGVPTMLMFDNLIDGEWLSDGARAPNVNPSNTKDVIGEAVRGTRAQAETAIAAAKAAFPAWSRSTPQVRYDILKKASDE